MDLTSRLGHGGRDRTVKFGRAAAVPTREGRSVAMWRYRRFLGVAGLVLAFLWAAPDAKSDVKIDGLSDLNLGTWSGAGDLTGDITHCVLNTVAPRKFTIEASGDGAGGGFAVLNGAASLPIQVEYNDGNGFQAVTANTPITNQAGQNQTKFDACVLGTGTRLTLRILILGTDMSAATGGGAHTGTIYLTVTAQ